TFHRTSHTASPSHAAHTTHLSPLSLHDALPIYLERIEQLDGALNAYISVRAEEALAEADHAPDGPLHGVPVAVKDVIDVAGVPTDRKSTRLNSSHRTISYAVLCFKKKKKKQISG